MDLKLNLTGLSEKSVSKILTYVARETSPDHRVSSNPANHAGVQEFAKWARKQKQVFGQREAEQAFPARSTTTVRSYIKFAYQLGYIKRVKYGHYLPA